MLVQFCDMTDNVIQVIAEVARISNPPESRSDRTDADLVKGLIRWKHFSPFEHITMRIKIDGISRTGETQLVRHRIASFNIRSGRKTSLEQTQFHHYVVPESVEKNLDARYAMTNAITTAIASYQKMIDLGIPAEDARFALPQAEKKSLYMSMNLRQARHIMEMRGSFAAQWEIREVALALYKYLSHECPEAVYDFRQEEIEGMKHLYRASAYSLAQEYAQEKEEKEKCDKD